MKLNLIFCVKLLLRENEFMTSGKNYINEVL